MPALRSSMKMATCKTSCAFSEAKVRLMDTPITGGWVGFYLLPSRRRQLRTRQSALPVPFWNNTSEAPIGCWSLADLLSFLLCLFFPGAFRFNPRDRALEPVLYVLPKLFFRPRRIYRISMLIQRDVMAGNVVCAVLLGHKVVKQTLMAGMRAGRVPMIGTGKRILEDRSGPPWRAIPISIATLLDEIQFIAQNFQHIPLIFRHCFLPGSPGS